MQYNQTPHDYHMLVYDTWILSSRFCFLFYIMQIFMLDCIYCISDCSKILFKSDVLIKVDFFLHAVAVLSVIGHLGFGWTSLLKDKGQSVKFDKALHVQESLE